MGPVYSWDEPFFASAASQGDDWQDAGREARGPMGVTIVVAAIATATEPRGWGVQDHCTFFAGNKLVAFCCLAVLCGFSNILRCYLYLSFLLLMLLFHFPAIRSWVPVSFCNGNTGIFLFPHYALPDSSLLPFPTISANDSKAECILIPECALIIYFICMFVLLPRRYDSVVDNILYVWSSFIYIMAIINLVLNQ